ncbi:MAG: acyl-CoA thioesterase domain-containing protein [Dehalococcoidia bacterium]
MTENAAGTTDDASVSAPREHFFRREGDLFVPTRRAVGPWNPNSLHGRVLAGLLARCLEEAYGDEAMLFTRLTVDMFRLPSLELIEVTTSVIREGNRIRVSDAVAVSEGSEIGRARAVQLRKAEAPENPVWKPAPWDAPKPEDAGRPRDSLSGMWDTWNLPRGELGQRRVWLRERHQLVEGEELTPFVRVAGCSDFASPLANAGEHGLDYVNADITLYLHRLPVGEYIGFEVVSHESADGIAVGDTTVYDVEGAIGRSVVCAVVNRRMRPQS